MQIWHLQCLVLPISFACVILSSTMWLVGPGFGWEWGFSKGPTCLGLGDLAKFWAKCWGAWVGGPTNQPESWAPEPPPPILAHAESGQMVGLAWMCLPGCLVSGSIPGCWLDVLHCVCRTQVLARAQPRGPGGSPTTHGVWGVHFAGSGGCVEPAFTFWHLGMWPLAQVAVTFPP